jgi:hypothetical protein
MGTLVLVLASILVVFALYAIVSPLALNYARFASRFRLPCPERHVDASVEVKAAGAALTSAYGGARVHMRRCSLLLPGEGCNEECLKGFAA